MALEGTPVMAWLVENVRFVIFTASPSSRNAQDLYVSYVDRSLQSFNTPALGVTVASGSHLSEPLELTVQSNRIDLYYSPEPNAQDPTLPVYLRNPTKSMSSGIDYVTAIAAAQSVIRIAFIVQSYNLASDQAQANSILRQKLPNLDIDDDALDFNYQINYRAVAKSIKGVEINRLCRWFAAHRLVINVQPSGVSSSPSTLAAVEIIDLNTATNTAIQQRRIRPMFNELLSTYNKIASAGYAALR